MAGQTCTPRINSTHLDSFIGSHVMIVGKVTQLLGDQAVVDSDGHVTVLLNRDAHLTNGNAAQIIGKVNPDLSVKVLHSQDLGPNVDMKVSSAVVEATHRHRDIFITDN
jgi:replication factor A3